MTYHKLHLKTPMAIYLAVIFFYSPLMAQDETNHNTDFNLNEEGVIASGYDVVSYFYNKPEKGSSANQEIVDGVIYWFANPENKLLFSKNPEKFIPAYGAWCAYAMAESGRKVKIDPKTYKIVDGKLYLFYNFYFNNTLLDWNKDEKSLMEQADLNWLKLADYQ